MNIKRFEQHFASIYRLLQPGGLRGKKIPDLHKVEFCPELKISKIGHQNSSIFLACCTAFLGCFQRKYLCPSKIHIRMQKMGSYVSRGERFFFNPCKSLTWFIQNCLLAECQNGRKICDQLTRNGSRGEVRWDFNFITFSIFQLPLFKRFMNTLTFAYYYLAQRHTYFGLNSMKSWSIIFSSNVWDISIYVHP